MKTASRAFMSGAKCRGTCSLQLLKNVEYTVYRVFVVITPNTNELRIAH